MRRGHAVERLIYNCRSKGYTIQEMTKDDVPLLAIKIQPTNVGENTITCADSDRINVETMVNQVAYEYGLTPDMKGPELAAGGIYVAWITLDDKM